MIKAFIFDMDGVLVDNSPVHVEAFRQFCARYGCVLDEVMFDSAFGKGNDEIIPLVLPVHIVDEHGIEALAEEKEIIYRDIFASTIAPLDGLVELLKELKANGYKCAVGSSGMGANVDFVLDKCGIREYFDAIVNGDMVTLRKPNPEIFLTAAKLLGVDPSESLVFEDSFAGIEAARRAGMQYVGVATTNTRQRLYDNGVECVIDNFTQYKL